MRALHPTEKTVLGILQRVLPPGPGHPGDLQELEMQGLLNNYEGKRGCCQGTRVHSRGLAAALRLLCSPSHGGERAIVLLLQEGAELIGSVLPSAIAQHSPTSIVTVLGDDMGLTEESLKVLKEIDIPVIATSLGPMQLLASQCITIVHHYLDITMGPSDTQKPGYDPQDPWLDKMRPCVMCYPEGLQSA
jgi:hypothetical protein